MDAVDGKPGAAGARISPVAQRPACDTRESARCRSRRSTGRWRSERYRRTAVSTRRTPGKSSRQFAMPDVIGRCGVSVFSASRRLAPRPPIIRTPVRTARAGGGAIVGKQRYARDFHPPDKGARILATYIGFYTGKHAGSARTRYLREQGWRDARWSSGEGARGLRRSGNAGRRRTGRRGDRRVSVEGGRTCVVSRPRIPGRRAAPVQGRALSCRAGRRCLSAAFLPFTATRCRD